MATFYHELGVRPVINAAGTLTRLGGSLMPPEVVEAMVRAAGHCVRMEDLQDRAGELIAEATGAESGYVTCGAAAGLSAVFAAPLTGIFFAMEVVLRDFSARTLAPIVVSSVLAFATVQSVLGPVD